MDIQQEMTPEDARDLGRVESLRNFQDQRLRHSYDRQLGRLSKAFQRR